MRIFLTALLLYSVSLICTAQKGPAAFTSQSLLFTGATIHTGDGAVIKDGVLAVKDKQITFSGRAADLPASMALWTKINVSGKHIYPGLIALNTQLGLAEIEAVDATNDFRETGVFTPNVRALIAYNTCLLYTSPSPRDRTRSRMPSSA